MDLPIPKTLRGWVISVSVLILIFIAYYGFLFNYLERFYRGFLYTKKISEQTSEYPLNLTLRVDAPDYIAPFGQRWLYFTIRNESNRPASDLWIGVEIQPQGEQTLEGWCFPFLFRDSLLLERSLHIERLQPHTSVSGRLPLWGSTCVSSSLLVTVTITDSETAEVRTPVTFPVKVNVYRYLAHSFIEQILLPPWSNGLIVVAVFVICTQRERRFQTEEWYLQILRAFRTSLILLLLLGGAVLILPSIPWWRQDIKGALLSGFFLLFLGLYSLWALEANLPPGLLWIEKVVEKMASKILTFGALRKIGIKPRSCGYILVLLLIWIAGLTLCRPALPLLQPLSWMAFAGLVIEVILGATLPLVYAQGRNHESPRNRHRGQG